MHKAVDPNSVELTEPVLNAGAQRIAEGEWVGHAVRSAITTQTAVLAASAAARSSGHGGGRGGSGHHHLGDVTVRR